jgi:hypothetical protein
VGIRSELELETIIREVILQLDKAIYARVSEAQLEAARRMLVSVRDALRRKEPLTERQIKGLNETAATLRDALRDERVNDLMWDVTDYFEFNKP